MIDLNKVSLGLLVGMIGGAAAGVGARLAMRGVAIAADQPPGFTLGGTLAILIFGMILGIPFGVIFVAVRRWLPGSNFWKGLIFGIALLSLFVAPPFLLVKPEGELALVSPLVGLSLFAPLPLAYGIVVAVAAERLEVKFAAAPERRVGAVWFGLFCAALLFAFISMTSLAQSPPFPPALTRAIQQAGIPFRIARGVNTALLLIFVFGYCGLAGLIFLRGSGAWMAKFAVLALLTFAGAFFNDGEILGGTMSALPIARWATGLARAAGWSSLLFLFYLFPDGQFAPRWARPLALAGSAWALWWFLNPLPGSILDLNTWPEPLLWLASVGFLGAGVVAQIARYRRALTPEQRREVKWVVVALTGAALVFALTWLAEMLNPGLHFARRETGLASLLVFVLYWLPWFLLPLSINFAMRRYRLWKIEGL